jgi:hypothetical protein
MPSKNLIKQPEIDNDGNSKLSTNFTGKCKIYKYYTINGQQLISNPIELYSNNTNEPFKVTTETDGNIQIGYGDNYVFYTENGDIFDNTITLNYEFIYKNPVLPYLVTYKPLNLKTPTYNPPTTDNFINPVIKVSNEYPPHSSNYTNIHKISLNSDTNSPSYDAGITSNKQFRDSTDIKYFVQFQVGNVDKEILIGMTDKFFTATDSSPNTRGYYDFFNNDNRLNPGSLFMKFTSSELTVFVQNKNWVWPNNFDEISSFEYKQNDIFIIWVINNNANVYRIYKDTDDNYVLKILHSSSTLQTTYTPLGGQSIDVNPYFECNLTGKEQINWLYINDTCPYAQTFNRFKHSIFNDIQNRQYLQIGQSIYGEVDGDKSGNSISLSSDGKIVAISARENDGIDENGNIITNSGHVRVYKYKNNIWEQLGQDIDGEAQDDKSGNSVSLSSDGKIVAIGTQDGNDNRSGHVRVYEYNGSSWIQLGRDINGDDANDWSGISVSLSSDGKTVAIGAHGSDGSNNDDATSNVGEFKVYNYNESSWIQLGDTIYGEGRIDYFGSSVSLSSNSKYIACGAFFNDNNSTDSGHVKIYSWNNTNNNWEQLGSTIEGTNGERLGIPISLAHSDGSDIRVAIGSQYHDGNSTNSGCVKVYRLGGIRNDWYQLGQDMYGEGSNDKLPSSLSLSLDGHTLIISSRNNNVNTGHVRIYKWNETLWEQIFEIDGENTLDYFGTYVSISDNGDTIAISATHVDNDESTDVGQVKVYKLKV